MTTLMKAAWGTKYNREVYKITTKRKTPLRRIVIVVIIMEINIVLRM